MPKIRPGLEYFSIQTNVNENRNIKLLKAEFGITGFGIWVELLRTIYADRGYYLKWDKETSLLFSDEIKEEYELVNRLVDKLVDRELFNKEMYDRYQVLTSEHIQESYLYAAKRRKEVKIDSRFLLIDLNDNCKGYNVDIKLLNVDNKGHSIVKENIVEQSKEQNIKDRRVDDDAKASCIPTLDEVKIYFATNGYSPKVAERAYNMYQASVEDYPNRKYWRDSRDQPIKNWKLKMQSVWFKEENKSNVYGVRSNAAAYRRLN